MRTGETGPEVQRCSALLDLRSPPVPELGWGFGREVKRSSTYTTAHHLSHPSLVAPCQILNPPPRECRIPVLAVTHIANATALQPFSPRDLRPGVRKDPVHRNTVPHQRTLRRQPRGLHLAERPTQRVPHQVCTTASPPLSDSHVSRRGYGHAEAPSFALEQCGCTAQVLSAPVRLRSKLYFSLQTLSSCSRPSRSVWGG